MHSSLISSLFRAVAAPKLQRSSSLGCPSTMAAFLSKQVCPESQARKIYKLLALWCARNNRPANIVEDVGLRDIFGYIEPGFRVPSHTHISALLKRKHEIGLMVLKEVLDRVDGIALTTDLWTSRATQSYATFTGHFIDPEWNLKACQLETSHFPKAHTGANIAAKVKDCVAGFGITNLMALVHDEAANMELAGRTLEDDQDLPSFSSITCCPHRLQNCVKGALSCHAVSKLLSASRKIVGHFRHSCKATQALLQQQEMEAAKVNADKTACASGRTSLR